MKVSELNGVKIYDLSSGKSIPEYLEEAKKRKIKLKQLEEYTNRIDLIQDLDYPVSSQRLRVSEDGHYIITTGVYPPKIKIFETAELSLKCERGIDSEVVQFQALSSDYTKLAFLCADRNIELHAQYGRHFKIRIPKFGRDMIYQPYTCDLVTVGATNEIYRLNLDLGRFQSPFESQSPELTCIDFSHELNSISVGGIDGKIEFWDFDSNKCTSQLAPSIKNEEISCVKFQPGTLNFLVGTEKGKVIQYDMRYPLPIRTYTHHYKLPIKQIKINSHSNKLITCDRKIVKIWNIEDGSLFTNIEPKSEINDVEICNDGSGMIFCPQEQEKIGAYFIPSLGPAPKWCTFLEQLTEELEESKSTTLYEDYKFLTPLDLEKLNASHLIGTPALKAYMHGYFMDLKAYQKLVSAVNPFAYEQYKKQQIENKMKALTEKRISLRKQQPKINIDYLRELQQRDTEKSGKGKKNGDVANQILEDNRFKKLFEDDEFKIDKNDEQYKLLKPTAGKNIQKDIESDEEAAPVSTKYQQRNLNNLFADQNDNENSSGSEDGATFQKKIAKDKKKNDRKSKDKIIKNYSLVQSSTNQKMKELGEKLLMQKNEKSKTISKFSKKKQGQISEKDHREKMKNKRIVISSRNMK